MEHTGQIISTPCLPGSPDPELEACVELCGSVDDSAEQCERYDLEVSHHSLEPLGALLVVCLVCPLSAQDEAGGHTEAGLRTLRDHPLLSPLPLPIALPARVLVGPTTVHTPTTLEQTPIADPQKTS